MRRKVVALGAAVAVGLGLAADGAENRVELSRTSDDVCIASNGVPDHDVGQFPNRGNPHAMRAQRIEVCVPAEPVKGAQAREVVSTGIATNGVLIRPGTADYYDASSARGFSRDSASGWNLEAMGAGVLGLDAQNAHVDHRGFYHYHGMPEAFATDDSTLVGYAVDGFEIHYVGSSVVPSYMLKPGSRASAPGGAHDGTYVEDWQYVSGLGNLDRCNGAEVNGRYVYFATDAYPFFPRCLYGTEIASIR